MSTIKEVAVRAGVSTATVSRALSNPDQVLPDTRTRVLEAIRVLGYAPNYAAKSLRTLRSDKLIVLVPDIANPFFSKVIQGVEEAAQANGYSVLLGDTRDEPERENQYADMLRRKEAAGLIFLGPRLPAPLMGMVDDLGGGAPIVNACDFSDELGVSSAHIDNFAAAKEAMDLLYDLGHRLVGIIAGPPSSPLNRERLRGARASAIEHGLSEKAQVQVTDFLIESGEREAAAMLGSAARPSAFFCFSDELALGALSAIRTRGLACPADVSLIGFDDVQYARFLNPPLTTVRQPMAEIGREAVRLMIDILEGRIVEQTVVTLRHELVLRASTRPPPR